MKENYRLNINNVEYEILEVNSNSKNLIVDGTFRVAAIHYDTAKIYLARYLKEDIKYSSLIHEITHAYICSYGMLPIKQFDQELMCEFIAAYGGKIIDDVNDYFDHKNRINIVYN